VYAYLPGGLFASRRSRNQRTLKRKRFVQGSARYSTEPRNFTKLVLDSCVFQPCGSSMQYAVACFRTVRFRFCRETLRWESAAYEVPYRTVPSALSCVDVLMCASAPESRAGQIGVETLDRPDDWIAKGEGFRTPRKGQHARQDECGQNAGHE